MYTQFDLSLPFQTKPDPLEASRKIIFEKLQAFINQVKSDEQPFEIKREDGLKISFAASEIQDCLSQMEQELLIVERGPFYYLEWDISVPLTDADNDQNYFGQSFNVRKLNLVEAIINRCFGDNVCRGNFKPSMMPVDGSVPGRVCIEGIAQIIESAQVASQEENTSTLQAENRWRVFTKTNSKTNEDPNNLDRTLVI